MPPSPYPLLLSPLLFPKVWGGDRLARFNKPVNPGDKIGESWELADLPSTSASGAGGGAAISTIANGPLAGKTLHDAVTLWGHDLLGASSSRGARFPLLVKYLDARENLSVQVHPSIAYTKTHPDAHLKTECWYILEADPGAVIYKGTKPGVTRQTFEKKLRTGDASGIIDDLVAVPAVVGEMHNLPSGTIHALGAGVVVAEVQTPSDTTFRVYDWGRQGRELHIDEALECIQFGPAREATRLPRGAISGRLVTTGYFAVDEIWFHSGVHGGLYGGAAPLAPATPGPERPGVLIVLDGEIEVKSSAGSFESLVAPPGSTVLIPACLAGTTSAGGNQGLALALHITVLGP